MQKEIRLRAETETRPSDARLRFLLLGAKAGGLLEPRGSTPAWATKQDPAAKRKERNQKLRYTPTN